MNVRLPYAALIVTAAALLMLWSVPICFAQSDLENAITYYGEENVRGYIQPLADFYGANINTGFFRTAKIPREGFHLSVDIIGMGAPVKEAQKTYMVTLPPGFTQRTAEQPTIVGPKATTVYDPGGLQYKGSDGMIDASLFAYGVGQVTVGSLMGTEAFFRILTTPELSSGVFPTTTLIGGGVRHSVSQYLVNLPVELAVGFSYNRMSIGDVLDVEGMIAGAQGSMTWDMFTLYGGAAWEKSTLKLEYTSTGSLPEEVSMELDGDNTFRFTAGGLLDLGGFRIFADANVGSITNFSGGIGFGN